MREQQDTSLNVAAMMASYGRHRTPLRSEATRMLQFLAPQADHREVRLATRADR